MKHEMQMSGALRSGTLIRARRMDLGLKQAELASRCGISASYLNLIEHNRRRIGGALIGAIAEALQVDPATLVEGAGGRMSAAMRAAASRLPEAAVETDRAEDLSARFPGWSRLIAQQDARIQQMERIIEVLNNRLTHDPLLGNTLHDVLTTATAIRSTSGILADDQQVDPEWQARFHRNLYEDSQRLADAAGTLVRYLESGADAHSDPALTPLEELESWLAETNWRLTALDEAPGEDIATILSKASLETEAGRRLAAAFAVRYAQDARQMPAAGFDQAMAETPFDPMRLSTLFQADLPSVLRRMGVRGAGALVMCDGSGTLTFRKPADGFDVPRFGAACPLWPLYETLQRPMVPIQTLVALPGADNRRFQAFAISTVSHPQGFTGPALIEATMLLQPVEGGEEDTARGIGTSCRICPRSDCAARRETSILGDGL